MDNFIEDSVNYLFFNGGFNLITGDQVFEFRIRPDSEIEVTSTKNHIKKVYKGVPEIYQFFAFLIFCDMYSARQKTTIILCKDKNVSRNNLIALNQVYNIYKTMLCLTGEELYDAITSDDPAEIDYIMLNKAYNEEIEAPEHLKFELLKSRIETFAFHFARNFEYWNNLYDEFLATEEYEQLHEYAMVRLEELHENIEASHPDFFTREEALSVLFSRVKQLTLDLELDIEGGEEEKHFILDKLMILYDLKIDIMDIIMIIKNAFEVAIINEKDAVGRNEFLEAIELSYLPDDMKEDLSFRLAPKKVEPAKKDNILVFRKLK